MQNLPCSWLSPKLESRKLSEKGGHGVFALKPIPKDTLIAMFGGTIVTGEQLVTLTETLQSLSIQVHDDLFLVSTIIGAGDHINHSCNPNCGIQGQIAIVAMRDINAGEEATFDYAMCDTAPYDEFSCECCRKSIKADDWQSHDLWEQYQGYFSYYIQQKIDEILKQERQT
ncbi:MAG: SET domain-containing protein [Chloroflexota bacterium]